MATLSEWKERVELTTKATGLALALVYVAGLLVTNVYLARYGITDFALLRVRYLTTGTALLGFSFAPLMLVLLPIAAWVYLRGRGVALKLVATFFSLGITSVTVALVLMYVTESGFSRGPLYLYSIAPPASLGALVDAVMKWFSPIILVVSVYIPSLLMTVARRYRKFERLTLVVCLPLIVFGAGSVVTRFGVGHFEKLKPAFGGPTTFLADVVATDAPCTYLDVPVDSASQACTLSGVVVIHESEEYIVVRSGARVVQLPRSQVRLVAPRLAWPMPSSDP